MSVSNPGETVAPPQPAAVLANRYRLDRRLAQGGMAEVWVGSDLLLSRQVAVKLLKPNLAADPVVAERFRREAVAVAQLSHPNIVTVYDAVDDDVAGTHRQAVVMQLISGKSLRQLLDDQKKLSPELTIHIGSCVATALDAAHRAGLVHRDVKPGNILITPDGRVLLTDFGIAKGVADAEDLTSENIMMGTAKYLSPEQVRGKKLDGRADLYSLGLVLYECLAGRVPFLGQTDAETALARLNRDPTDISRLRPTLPAGLADVVHKLLARRPEDRFGSGADLRSALVTVNSRSANAAAHAPTPAAGQPMRVPKVGGSPASPMRSRPRQDSPARRPPAGPMRATPARSTPTRSTPPGGYQVGHGGRPAGQPLRADRTPPNPSRPALRPNRAFSNRGTPSMWVVGGLLAAALIMVIVIVTTMRKDPVQPKIPLPKSQATTTVAPRPAAAAKPTLALFDPSGDGVEDPANVRLALDGKAATVWRTACYASSRLGGKPGVGVILDLKTPQQGTVDVTIASAPYGVQVLTAPNGAAPTSIEAMDIRKRAEGNQTGTVTATVDTPVRYVAVVFVELARDNACGGRRFRGAIADVQWTKG